MVNSHHNGRRCGSTWTYTLGADISNDTTSYWIVSRAIDRATNYELNPATVMFICDKSAPISNTTYPVYDLSHSSPISTITNIVGTAFDYSPGQVNSVQLMIFCPAQFPPPTNANNKYWTLGSGVHGTAANWSTTPTPLNAVYSNGSWTFDASGVAFDATNTPGFEYQIWSTAIDKAGNYETSPSTDTFWFAAPFRKRLSLIPQTILSINGLHSLPRTGQRTVIRQA